MPEITQTTAQETAKAVAEALETSNTTETKTEETKETKTEETKEEVKEPSESEKRAEKALELLDILEDREKGPVLLKKLAEQAGLLEAKTKTEEKEATSEFVDLIKAELGEDFFLTPQLSKALDKVAHKILESVDKKIQETKEETQRAEVTREYDSFISANKVTEAEIKAIDILSNDIAPAANVSLSNYLGKLLKVVRAESTESNLKTKLAQKVDTNSKERLGGNSTADVPREPKQYKTMRDLVADTLREQLEG